MTIVLQLSSAQGPDECCLAVAKAWRRLEREATSSGVTVSVMETEPGPRKDTFASVLLSLEGEEAEALAERWQGTLRWVCQSPYRPNHGRKNWFIGVQRFDLPEAVADSEVRFEATRASGPGGQHVNKTDSAIRATHLATGISVKVQSERSQHANKRLALRLIAFRLKERREQADADHKARRRLAHYRVERGDPTLCFKGEAFELVS